MATFTRSDWQGAEFVDASLRGARFVRTDLSGVVMRRPAPSTCRSTASGPSRRRCETWSWRPTPGWVGRSWGSSSRSTPSVRPARDEAMGSTWNYLDVTALGRQEEWEDSPEGYPQTSSYEWWNYHDAYGQGG